MFTATWPDSVRLIASEFLNDPIRVNVGSETLSANHRVTQYVEVVEQHQKESRLPQLLQKYHNGARESPSTNLEAWHDPIAPPPCHSTASMPYHSLHATLGDEMKYIFLVSELSLMSPITTSF